MGNDMDISSDDDSFQGVSTLIIQTAGLLSGLLVLLEMELMEEDSNHNHCRCCYYLIVIYLDGHRVQLRYFVEDRHI
jgi:hypothetical protein